MIVRIETSYYRDIDYNDKDPWVLRAELSITLCATLCKPLNYYECEVVDCAMLVGGRWQHVPQWLRQWAEDWVLSDEGADAVDVEVEMRAEKSRGYRATTW